MVQGFEGREVSRRDVRNHISIVTGNLNLQVPMAHYAGGKGALAWPLCGVKMKVLLTDSHRNPVF